MSKVFALLTFVRVIFLASFSLFFMMVFTFKAQLRQAAVKLRQLEKGFGLRKGSSLADVFGGGRGSSISIVTITPVLQHGHFPHPVFLKFLLKPSV
ncbi:MAG TPA: hypothetical protein PLC47_11055 [Bacteroidales bacterium]|nr:hypothetical protein [Bacteroidales bacterium]